MKKILALAITTSLISGCVSTTPKPMNASIASSLKGQTVAKTVHQKPSFSAMTADKAMFAMLGAVAMIASGNSIVANNNIEDPADSIATSLARTLESNYSARAVPMLIQASSSDVEDISAATKGAANLVLDVRTINWNFAYFPTDWTHYRVMYTAKAQLIDPIKKSVLSEAFCKHIPETNVNAPTYDELLANGAERLKKELGVAADECLKSLKTDMLAL